MKFIFFKTCVLNADTCVQYGDTHCTQKIYQGVITFFLEVDL